MKEATENLKTLETIQNRFLNNSGIKLEINHKSKFKIQKYVEIKEHIFKK